MLLSELVGRLNGELPSLYRVRRTKAYISAMRSVINFAGEDCKLGEIFNPEWLMGHEYYLRRKGLKRNTVSFYMRMLRSMYNQAVDMGVYVQIPRLFQKVFTGMDKTIKRSVSPDMIAMIGRIKLSGAVEFCRDIFMICFYLQGMSFVDLAYLKKTNLQGNYIVYNRRKTNSQITVRIFPKTRRLLEKYMCRMEDSEYLFPIIVNMQKDEQTQYQSALRAQNRNLKKLAEILGLEVTLTSYVARHSWATMAYHNGVPTTIISEAMGHKTEVMTRIYLTSFGLDRLSEAGDTVMRAVDESEKKMENTKGKRRKTRCPSPRE